MLTWCSQISPEDFQDVVGLLPENTPLPASEKMTYLLARLEVGVHLFPSLLVLGALCPEACRFLV